MYALALLLLSAALVATPRPALASDSVEAGGIIYTCDNRCVVTHSNGRYTVIDCCGGRIHFRFNPR